jgi:anti-anti-sigma factor
MLSYRQEDDRLVVSFEGNLDSAACLELEGELYERVEACRGGIEFDLDRVPYIASMFLRVCTKVVKQVGTGRLVVSHACEPVLKVFRVSRIDRFVDVRG